MEIKEKIAEELEEYIQMFDKYDNELTESVEKKETEYQKKRKIFDEKWEEDIFPTDIPIRDQEAKELEDEADMLKEEKQKLKDDIKKSEQRLKLSISDWENKIDSRRKELAEYGNNRENYVEQKEKLEKELEEQIKGVELWEKNGINPNDVLYRRRKDVIIPNLEKQIKDIDLILDESSIRKEYKELGELKKQIKAIKLHDRKHIIPELAEIFELKNSEPEQDKSEQDKTEQDKSEQDKSEQDKSEQDKLEQDRTEQYKTEQDNNASIKANPVQLVIGRNILIKGADGKTDKIGKVKEYFEYEKDLDLEGSSLSKKLREWLFIDEKDPISQKLENVDSIIAFGLIKGLDKGLLSKQDVLKAIEAISIKNKELLDNTLPIEWDKRDLSKGAFLPWNRKNRDEVIKHADENSEITNVTGEYEPNPVKRFLKRAKQALPQRKKQEQITDGRENKSKGEDEKNTKLREEIKVSEAYLGLNGDINSITNKTAAEEWLKSYKEKKSDGKLAEKEAKTLHQDFMKQLHKIIDDKQKGKTEEQNNQNQGLDK